MESRKLIGIASLAILVIAVAILYARVSRSASSEVDPQELAKAKVEYRAGAQDSPASEVSKEPPIRAAPRIPRREPEPPKVEEPPPRAPPARTIRPTRRTIEPIAENKGEIAPYPERVNAVSKLYDRHRYPEARQAAIKMLDEKPDDRKMLRVVVSVSCIMGEPDTAREYYEKLLPNDKKTMRLRCGRYGVDDLD